MGQTKGRTARPPHILRGSGSSQRAVPASFIFRTARDLASSRSKPNSWACSTKALYMVRYSERNKPAIAVERTTRPFFRKVYHA